DLPRPDLERHGRPDPGVPGRHARRAAHDRHRHRPHAAGEGRDPLSAGRRRHHRPAGPGGAGLRMLRRDPAHLRRAAAPRRLDLNAEPSVFPAVGSPRSEGENTMPRGDKSKYTDKQERKAEHIAEGYEARGVSEKEAERRAWATV